MGKKTKNAKTKSMGKIFHKKTTVDGIEFDSKTEADYYTYLKANKAKLKIKEFSIQPKFELQPKYILTPDGEKIDYINDKQFKKEQKKYPKCTVQSMCYIADFLIEYIDGTIEVIDIKGIKTADFKIKEKIFNYLYPKYKGLKCIAIYRGEWLLWDEYKSKQKANKKNKK